MFTERTREDRNLAGGRPGIVDVFVSRFGDRRFLRRLAEAAARAFPPGRALRCRLDQGRFLALTGVRRCRVVCERGAVWVTAGGDGRDHVLTPGEGVSFARCGKVVITGRGGGSEVEVRWD